MSEAPAKPAGPWSRELAIINRNGIHARPAALIVKTASRYNADVSIAKGKNKVSGKSIMGLMTLEAGRGVKLVVTAEGPDGEQVLDEIQRLFEAGFDEM